MRHEVTNLFPRLIFESSCSYSVSWVIVKCFTGNVKWLRELTNFESYSDVRLCMTGSMNSSVNLEGDQLKLTDHEWSRLLFTLAPERRSDQVRCEPNHSRHCVHWHVETSEILEMPHGSRNLNLRNVDMCMIYASRAFSIKILSRLASYKLELEISILLSSSIIHWSYSLLVYYCN